MIDTTIATMIRKSWDSLADIGEAEIIRYIKETGNPTVIFDDDWLFCNHITATLDNGVDIGVQGLRLHEGRLELRDLDDDDDDDDDDDRWVKFEECLDRPLLAASIIESL